MPSLYDFNFTGDDPGTQTDPEPDAGDDWLETDGEDDVANYKEPGSGDTFTGGDPSVWSGRGDPDEPEDQNSDVPPVETESQTATDPDDAINLDQSDDPEKQEHPGDEAVGDDEDDGPPDPADIDAGRATDSTDEVRYPEQGFDSSDLTYRTPEQVIVEEDVSYIPDFVQMLKDDLYARMVDSQNQWVNRYGHLFGLSPDEEDIDTPELEIANLVEMEDDAVSEFGVIVDDETDITAIVEFEDELAGEFTSPTGLLQFSDVLGGIDVDTLLVEFNLVAQDDV